VWSRGRRSGAVRREAASSWQWQLMATHQAPCSSPVAATTRPRHRHQPESAGCRRKSDAATIAARRHSPVVRHRMRTQRRAPSGACRRTSARAACATATTATAPSTTPQLWQRGGGAHQRRAPARCGVGADSPSDRLGMCHRRAARPTNITASAAAASQLAASMASRKPAAQASTSQRRRAPPLPPPGRTCCIRSPAAQQVGSRCAAVVAAHQLPRLTSQPQSSRRRSRGGRLPPPRHRRRSTPSCN